MDTRLLALSALAYRAMLRAYPRTFRERFAGEMAQVFLRLCQDTYIDASLGGLLHLWLSVLGDWLRAVITQWWLSLGRRKGVNNMLANMNNPDGEIRPLSRAYAGLAVLPFLLFGISSLVSKLNVFQTQSAGSPPLWQVVILQPYMAFNWLVLIGLGIAMVKSFPRWGYSFLGWAVLFGWWWSDMAFFGYRSDWKIWLPFVGVIVLVLVIRRSVQPLRILVAGLWKDWTLLSFAIYILYSWVFMLYDENHHPYLLVFVLATTLVTALGAWGYFRSGSPVRRVLALVGGLLLATIANTINDLTWDFEAYHGLPPGGSNANLVGIIFFAVLTAIMVANGLVATWRQSRSRMKMLRH